MYELNMDLVQFVCVYVFFWNYRLKYICVWFAYTSICMQNNAKKKNVRQRQTHVILLTRRIFKEVKLP